LKGKRIITGVQITRDIHIPISYFVDVVLLFEMKVLGRQKFQWTQSILYSHKNGSKATKINPNFL